MYKNNLVTCYYAGNVRSRNEKNILSNFFNGSLTLEIEKGRYTKPVTPLSFRSCNLKCLREWKTLFNTFWISVIHCDLTYLHSTTTVMIYILVYFLKKSIKLQAIGMWLVRKQLISYFLVYAFDYFQYKKKLCIALFLLSDQTQRKLEKTSL